MALVEGLEQIPAKEVQHRGITLRELDLDAALERHPQILLVDELAHSNAPGCRHLKRYQDVEELLRNGISVFTTVNVQHIEGLNDKIAAVTGISVQERFPDLMFDNADSVELIDIEPSDLIERLRAGKVYLPERAGTALANFFSQKNLAALREVALRRMVDRLNRKAERRSAGTAHVEASEDVLVYLTGEQGNVRAIRAAANLAESLHGSLTALVVTPSGGRSSDGAAAERLRSNIDLAEKLGAHVVTLHGDDVARLIAQYAASAGITQLVVGASRQRGLAERLRGSVASRLTRLSYGATVIIVLSGEVPARLKGFDSAGGLKPASADALKALAAVAAGTVAGWAVYGLGLGAPVVLMLYILSSLLFATRADSFSYAIFAALGSMLAYNFFFTAPRFTFQAYAPAASMIFAFLLMGTLIASSLTIRMRRQTIATARRAFRTEVLLESDRKLQACATVEECFEVAARQVIKILDRPVVMYLMGVHGRLGNPEVFDVTGSSGSDATRSALTSPEEAAVASWVAANGERAGATTDTLSEARCLYLPIRSRLRVLGVAGLVMEDDIEDFGAFEKNLLTAILDECGQVSGQLQAPSQR